MVTSYPPLPNLSRMEKEGMGIIKPSWEAVEWAGQDWV